MPVSCFVYIQIFTPEYKRVLYTWPWTQFVLYSNLEPIACLCQMYRRVVHI